MTPLTNPVTMFNKIPIPFKNMSVTLRLLNDSTARGQGTQWYFAEKNKGRKFRDTGSLTS
jgi:hypothetical protein